MVIRGAQLTAGLAGQGDRAGRKAGSIVLNDWEHELAVIGEDLKRQDPRLAARLIGPQEGPQDTCSRGAGPTRVLWTVAMVIVIPIGVALMMLALLVTQAASL